MTNLQLDKYIKYIEGDDKFDLIVFLTKLCPVYKQKFKYTLTPIKTMRRDLFWNYSFGENEQMTLKVIDINLKFRLK